MADASDRIRNVVQRALDALELDLYDVEMRAGLVRVIVDRPGGVDLEAVGAATRAVSRALDEADPIAHRYTLEVTSPGVERPLRTPEQFVKAVGEQVKVKAVREVDGARRFEGRLAAADDAGITLQSREGAGEAEGGAQWRLAYDDISKARTVFEWGAPSPAPDRSGKKKRKRERRS